jgi:arylsulfatase A-like enzyme
LTGAGVLSLALLAAAAPAKRPNILFIMTDDHASHAISAYGSRVNSTPHLDRLAREGMLFRNAFVTNSICTPSRAAMLTGKYSHLNGVTVFNRFDGQQQTVAKLLQAGGYHTGMIGKWHLGSDPTGFDHWEILPGQGAYNDPVLYTATGEKKYPGYVTGVLTGLALQFLEQRPRDRPFFLMWHHKAPHRPWVPEEKYRREFADRKIPEPKTLWDDYRTRTDALHENQQRVAKDLTRRDLKLAPPPGMTGTDLDRWLAAKPEEVVVTIGDKETRLAGEALTRWKYQRYMRDYLACVQSVDDGIGRVLDFLKSAGLERDTVVVYTSDQGFYLGDHGLYDKRFMYEESLRTPLLVRWPAAVRPGSRNERMALNVDFAPTFLELAGLPASAEMQGRSLLPLLRGQKPAGWRQSMYYRYYHDPGDHNTRAHYGVRTERHKLIHFWKKDQWELYDLKKDPNELDNLHGRPGQEKLTLQLQAELQRLKRELRDEDQLASEQIPNGVDGPPQKLRGK